MNKGSIILVVIAGVLMLMLMLAWERLTNSEIVGLKERIDIEAEQIKEMLLLKSVLAPRFEEYVVGERREAIVVAKKQLITAIANGEMRTMKTANDALSSALEVVESQPRLIINTHFMMLKDDLDKMDAKLRAGIKEYNKDVSDYNHKVTTTFLISIVAKLNDLEPKPFFGEN